MPHAVQKSIVAMWTLSNIFFVSSIKWYLRLYQDKTLQFITLMCFSVSLSIAVALAVVGIAVYFDGFCVCVLFVPWMLVLCTQISYSLLRAHVFLCMESICSNNKTNASKTVEKHAEQESAAHNASKNEQSLWFETCWKNAAFFYSFPFRHHI